MRTLIIAEAGVNHNGSLETACTMVEVAAKAGADYVKFQSFRSDALVREDARKAEYQTRNTGSSSTQREMLEGLELGYDDFEKLKACCRQTGIGFLSSPFDVESLRFLLNLGMDYLKLPSGELTNYPMLIQGAASGLPVLMSTGMATLEEVGEALCLLKSGGSGEVILLQCNTDYPTRYEDANLRAMGALSRVFQTRVGYSDHTLGIEAVLAATALEACVIEKHFTLDRSMAGPDHCISLEPDELRTMIDGVRRVEACLGVPDKKPTPSESLNRPIVRKSIVAACDICCGELLTEDKLTTKRPGGGLSPMLWPRVLGTFAIRAFKKDEYIEI